MSKQANKSSESKNKNNRLKKYQNAGAIPGMSGFGASNQFGTFQDPYTYHGRFEPNLDVVKAAGAGFLGNRMSSKAYFDWLAGDDPSQADLDEANMRSNRSALITGAATGLATLATQYGQQRDYNAYRQKIARQQADEYYRVPYDRYAYNDFLGNAYGATAYKNGGVVRYEDGGGIEDEEAESAAPRREQVYFDSTVPETPNPGMGGYNNYGEYGEYGEYGPNDDPFFPNFGPEDDIPTDEAGIPDPSKFIPTFGGMPIRYATPTSSVESIIAQIGEHESRGRYDVVNTAGGDKAINATGKYQFVPKYWHKEIAQFQGTVGKSMEETMEVFRNNPKTQEEFMRHVVQKYYMPEMQTLLPLAKQYGIDQAGLIKMLHYRGIKDTRDRLRTGNFEVSESEKKLYNNPDILKYVRGY